MKHYFFIFLIFLTPAFSNAQDLGRCSREDISIVEKFRACKSAVTDTQYTKSQQARAAKIAGLLNQFEKGSVHETIGLFLLAVDKGDLSGFAHIGDVYREGDGAIAKDFEKALDYYYRDTSNSPVKTNGLALLNLYGQGVEQNYAKALALTWMTFQQSANSLYSDRMCNLYTEEKYRLQNIAKAHMWCNFSVKLENHPQLKAFYEDKRFKLAAKLSPTQLAQSNNLLKKCESSSYMSCEVDLNIN